VMGPDQKGTIDAGPGVQAGFEPRMIAFCCNWCAYAGADLAGAAGARYPPNVRIIKLMCTGRLEPIFILKALEMGADGVIIAGCHPGDCHYISGNLDAERNVHMVLRLLEMLGIEKRRLRLEWISASEGARFAQVVTEFTEEVRALGPANIEPYLKPVPREKVTLDGLIEETGAYDCVECGKCTTLCPIAKIDPNFAPRLLALKASDSASSTGTISDDILKQVWTCLTCAICSDKCPYKVMYSEFVQGLREMAFGRALLPLCSQGGVLHSISRLHTVPHLKQRRLDWVTDDLKIAKEGEMLLWIGCAPYFDVVFQDRAKGLLDGPRASIKLLNRAGIVPVVSKDERCCGHDLFWAGDVDGFQKLAERNVELIRATGAKKVVLSCPEGYRTMKQDYPLFVGDLEFEVLHLSEVILKLVDEGKLKFKPGKAESVTYHDGCRLGRHMGVYEQPRAVLKAMGVELKEMARNREACPCCGVNAWLNCNASSKQIQVERLMEAKATGAQRLLIACPKCLIHYQCTEGEKVSVEPGKVDIPLEDIFAFMARHLE